MVALSRFAIFWAGRSRFGSVRGPSMPIRLPLSSIQVARLPSGDQLIPSGGSPARLFSCPKISETVHGCVAWAEAAGNREPRAANSEGTKRGPNLQRIVRGNAYSNFAQRFLAAGRRM